MHVLGTRVPRRLGVARSASSPKAAQALGCSLTPGLRISFGRVTCMARAASVPGLWALGFLLLACVCGWVRVAVGRGFCLPLPVVAGVLGGCVWARFVVLSLFCRPFVVFVVGPWCRPAFGTCVVSCAFPLPPPFPVPVCGVGVRAGPGSRLCPALLGFVVGLCFLRFFFFFFFSRCWMSLSRALWSLPPSPFFRGGLLASFFFFFFCLFWCPFSRWAAVPGLVLPVLAGWSPCACLGVLSSVPSGWGVWPPCVFLAGGLVAVGCFAQPPPPPFCFFFFFFFGGGGAPGCSSLCFPSAGACSVAGVWCGWSLATPGGGSCVLLPATPGWVSLPVVVGGPRHSWLGSAGGGGVWCVALVCWWGCGWCVVWLVPRHSWRRFLCATPRHSWLGFAAAGGGRSPPLLAGVRLRRCVWCVVCGGGVLVGLWLVCGVVGPSPLLAEVPVCYSPPLLAGFRCRWWWAVPATPGWGSLAAVVCGVWRWCVGGVVAGVWCGWSLATPGGGSCVLLPATPGWVSLPLVVGCPRHSWLGSAGGVGVWCVAVVCCWGCGWCVVWLVPRHSWRRSLCATPRHSWLGFAAAGGGRSPPLLAGDRWRRGCVVCGVLLGSLATPGGGSCVLLPATPGWVSLPLVVGGPRHSWLGSACGGGVRALLGWVGPLCLSALLGPLRAGVAPLSFPAVAVPRWLGFVVCGLAVAWHLFVCRGSLRVVRALRVCGTRRPSLLGTCPCALVVAGGVPLWRALWPRVVRRASSGPVALGAPVGFPDAVVPFPTPGACAPGFTGRLRGARGGRPRTGLIVPAAGPRRGRDAGLAPRRTRSGPRDGVVPGGSLRRRSWAACAAVVGVWTRSLTRPISRTVCRSTGDSAGAPGLFRVDADTSPCGSEDATPGSRACLRVRALLGRVGRAGLPGAFWCASPFPLAALSFCFAGPPPGCGCPFLFRCCCRSSLVVFLGLPLPCSPLVWLSRLAVGCSLVVAPPPPPPFVSRGFRRSCLWPWCSFFFFFLLLLLSPCAPVVSGFLWFPAPGCPGPRRLRCLFCWPSASRLSVRLSLFRAFRLAFGCSRVVAAPPPPPLCLAVFVPAARCCVPCCAVRPWVRCCAALLRVVSPGVVLSCALLRSFGAAACCALPSGAARRPRALCSAALCFAALCFAVFPRAVCSVLCVFCRGAVVRAVRSLCSPLCAVLCFAVLVRSRCAVRVVRAFAGAWCCGALLCVVLFPVVCRGAVLGLVARGCLLVACFGVGVPVWPPGLLPCGWCGLLWCPAFLCRVLWCCAVAWCCAVVLCCRVAVLLGFALPFCGLSCCCVVLLVGCAVFGPVAVSACCGALFLALCVPRLLRSVRCGALLCWLWCPASLCRVLWRCALVWCCAVVLCCRFAVLFVFALPSCGVSCGACVVCAVVGASCCGLSLCVVVSPRAFCGVVVLLWCVVVSCCAVRCPVVSCALCRVLRCRAVLRCCAGWLCCAVVCAAGVCFALFSFAKDPCRFSVPLKTLFFFFLKIKKKNTRPNTLACSKTMFAAVPYMLPVVLDVLGPRSCAWRRGACWCPLQRVNRVPPGPPPELQGKGSDGHEGGEGGAWRIRRKRRQGAT